MAKTRKADTIRANSTQAEKHSIILLISWMSRRVNAATDSYFGIHSFPFPCNFCRMKVIKAGRHRLFENDLETGRVVSEMLRELERAGMDAVRRYSQKLDQWSASSFELSAQEVDSIIDTLPERVVTDTDFCQGNAGGIGRRRAGEEEKDEDEEEDWWGTPAHRGVHPYQTDLDLYQSQKHFAAKGRKDRRDSRGCGQEKRSTKCPTKSWRQSPKDTPLTPVYPLHCYNP
jgi:hypothetical protein